MASFTCRTTSVCILTVLCCLLGGAPDAQAPIGNEQYTFKIYAVNSAFYPIVQVYLRTWDAEREPLPNVNYANIGLMVQGRSYDPMKFDPQTRRPQYAIETLQNREEAFRTVLVLDCSLSMAGKPFADAQNALMKYVEAKRPSDQIAVIAIRDTDQGYQLVSGFEKDPTMLYQRISDVECDGRQTRLYDAVAAAMEMCATASQGGMSNTGAEHAVLNTILVLSDGKDEGSAVARDELMNRIGQLPVPIPIYSLAYAKSDPSAFLNLEALSKGSFGRYWRHEDSQEFGATVQHIHRINRSDYVLTFRSYVEVDGAKHPLKIGISWPSNTGRFVFDSAQFEAVDSPAKYVAEGRDVFEKLQQAFPPLPTGCPYMDCPPVGAPAVQVTPPATLPTDPSQLDMGQLAQNQQQAPAETADAPAQTTPPQPVDAAPAEAHATADTDEPKEEDEAEQGVMTFLNDNGGLLGLGAGLLALVIVLLMWVKRAGANNAPRAGLTPTSHEGGQTGESSSNKESDTTTRF